MKRFFALLLAALLVLCLASCNDAEKAEETVAEEETTAADTTAVETTVETTVAETTAVMGTVPEGFTENEEGLLSPDLTPASIDMNRSLRLRALVEWDEDEGRYDDISLVVEVRDASSSAQRYNLTESTLALSAEGVYLKIEGDEAIKQTGNDCDKIFIEFSIEDEDSEKLEALTAAEEISVSLEATNVIQDVSSPYRDTREPVSCSLTLSEDDITILKTAMSLIGK